MCMHSTSAITDLPLIEALSQVGRFEMTTLMLDRAARSVLVAMFDALAARLGEAQAGLAATEPAEQLRKLRACYLGKE